MREGPLDRNGAHRTRRYFHLYPFFTYIHERNRSAATAVVERIEGLAALLGEFPLAGHVTDESDVRMFSVVRYPFLVFYTIDDPGGEVVILHVQHGAQQRP